MPALDATRRIFNPVDNDFLDIPDNVQFVAAVNRGSAYVGTFGIDPAQLDRFAPLSMGYPPPDAELALLEARFPDLPRARLRRLVEVADAVRRSADLSTGLSVRATEEAAIFLGHPLMDDSDRSMREILRSSFCGRFPGHPDDAGTEAGRGVGDRQGRPRGWVGGGKQGTAEFRYLRDLGETKAQVIEQMGATGQPRVIADHTEALAEMARRHNAGLGGLFCDTSSGAAPVGGLAALGLVALVRRRKR